MRRRGLCGGFLWGKFIRELRLRACFTQPLLKSHQSNPIKQTSTSTKLPLRLLRNPLQKPFVHICLRSIISPVAHRSFYILNNGCSFFMVTVLATASRSAVVMFLRLPFTVKLWLLTHGLPGR